MPDIMPVSLQDIMHCCKSELSEELIANNSNPKKLKWKVNYDLLFTFLITIDNALNTLESIWGLKTSINER